MTKTTPMEAPTDDELNHHGILGMKWGVRRFQKYPKGYSGDGKYVGPDGQPRQPTKKEAKRDRKYNELKSKIDKWLVDAVETGDKKALKRLKKTMTPQEYQAAYGNLVKSAVSNAVKEGDRKAIKAYKKDLTKKEFKEANVMADFNDAVNKMDTDKMNKLVSKIKSEDLKDAATRIATMTELQKKKIDSLKVESEMSAKLEKVGKTVSNVATIATKGKAIYDAVTGVMDSMQKREQASKELADKLNAENQKKEIDKVIKKGSEKDFEKIKEKMSNEQIKAFYERQYLNKKAEIDRAILTGDTAEKIKNAHLLDKAAVETINKAKDADSTYRSTWNKETQNEKYKAYNETSKQASDITDVADKAAKNLREHPFDSDAEKRYERAGIAERAALLVASKAEKDYKEYAAKDPTGETWGDAIKKKSAEIKSVVSDLKLTPSAKKARAEAESRAKKAQDIQMDAAKKVLDLYNRDPEKFLNGDQTFINPFTYADKKIKDLL